MKTYLVSVTAHDAETHEQIDALGYDYTEGTSEEQVMREWTSWEGQTIEDSGMSEVLVWEETGTVYYTDDEGRRVYVQIHVDEDDEKEVER